MMMMMMISSSLRLSCKGSVRSGGPNKERQLVLMTNMTQRHQQKLKQQQASTVYIANSLFSTQSVLIQKCSIYPFVARINDMSSSSSSKNITNFQYLQNRNNKDDTNKYSKKYYSNKSLHVLLSCQRQQPKLVCNLSTGIVPSSSFNCFNSTNNNMNNNNNSNNNNFKPYKSIVSMQNRYFSLGTSIVPIRNSITTTLSPWNYDNRGDNNNNSSLTSFSYTSKRLFANKRHKRLLKYAKGYRGRSKNCFTVAIRRVEKAWQHSKVDRKTKHRLYRRLWIMKIQAASRIYGLSYSRFIPALNQSNIKLNRKVLAELASHEPFSFKSVLDTATAVTTVKFNKQHPTTIPTSIIDTTVDNDDNNQQEAA